MIRSTYLSRFLVDYGMLLVLVLLCAFFSVITYQEQVFTGEAGAQQVFRDIARHLSPDAGVLIVTRRQTDELRFSDHLEEILGKAGHQVLGKIQGEPKDARAALQRILQDNAKLGVIACSQATAEWELLADLQKDFPGLGSPRILTPHSYWWPNFLKSENLLNIANQIAVIAIVAIGMTMIIISGGIDLSVGSLIALAAVVCARIMRDGTGGVDSTVLGMIAACAAAIVLSGGMGAFSGAMITGFHIPPFIVTLAMMLVASGLAFMLAEGQSIASVPDSFVWLGRGANLGIPNAVVLMFILYILAHVLMSRMKWGRYLYAVGGNREAARLSGVPVKKVILSAYIASGLLAGLGGVIMSSQLKSGSATYGTMYELYVIAAVVVGGTSLSGGEGKMMGTLIGAFTIAVIQNGMNLTNVESYTQKVVLGLVILGAVLLDRLRVRSA